MQLKVICDFIDINHVRERLNEAAVSVVILLVIICIETLNISFQIHEVWAEWYSRFVCVQKQTRKYSIYIF